MKQMALFLTVLLSSAAAKAADYFLPHTECDGSANVRVAPDTRSKIMTVLNYESRKHKILRKQGKWFHIQLDGIRTGYVHQSQGFIVHNRQTSVTTATPKNRSAKAKSSKHSQTERVYRLPQLSEKATGCGTAIRGLTQKKTKTVTMYQFKDISTKAS